MINTLDELINALTVIRNANPESGNEPICVFDSNNGEPCSIKYIDTDVKEIGTEKVNRVDIMIEL